MDLLYRINNALPESSTILSVNNAISLLKSAVANQYKIALHGSWFLDLAFDNSDIDIAIMAKQSEFQKVVTELRRCLQEFKHLQINKIINNADVKVISLKYDKSLMIDVSLQSESNLYLVRELKKQLDVYEFHDLYRAVKLILIDNDLYGHKVGGLNSFSICWMIIAMIKHYEHHSNLLILYPKWFGRTDDEKHLYTLVILFCNFYLNINQKRYSIHLVGTGTDTSVVYKKIHLSFDQWRDVKQPWLLRLYLDIHGNPESLRNPTNPGNPESPRSPRSPTDEIWISSKSWRYNHILALFHCIVNP